MRSRLAFLLKLGCVLASALDNSVTITEVTSSSQLNRPFTISRVFARGEIADYPQPYIGGTSVSPWQSDVKTRWSDGSVQHALVSFKTTLGSGQSVVVDFRNSSNPCSAGTQTACNNAALDEPGMLNFDSGNWGAVIEATAGGSAKSASARVCVDDARFSYWLRGPVVTQVICEDAGVSRSYDFGWTCASNCSGTYSSATWVSDTTNRSIHPIFILTFYAGWSGVKVDYIMQNAWTTGLQDQRYQLALKSGANGNTTEFGPHTFTQYARTSVRKTFWDGTEPGAVRVNLNLPYLVYSKALPSYDTTLVVPQSSIDTANSGISSSTNADTPLVCTTSGSTCAGWLEFFPNTGGRRDIALIPYWPLVYLYTYDTTLHANVLLQGDMSGSMPIHFRESRNSGNFNGAAGAFGRVVSIDNRPTFMSVNLSDSNTVAGDKVTALATLSGSSAHQWTIDSAHQPSLVFVPYLITGDWYYLQELYFWGAYNVSIGNPNRHLNYARHREWGLTIGDGQTRAKAWTLRNTAHAAFFAPDGSAEKDYFTEKVNNTFAVWEGIVGITDGRHYEPCTTSPFNANTETSKWCWGNLLANFGRTISGNPLHLPYRFCSPGNVDGLNTSVAPCGDNPWQINFMIVVLKHLSRLGFQADALQNKIVQHMIEKIKHPDSNPFILDMYRTPIREKKTHPTLSANITNSSTSLVVSSVPAWIVPNVLIQIDNEVMRVASASGTTITIHSTNGRGQNGTSAASHSAGASVVMEPLFQNWATWLTGITNASADQVVTTDSDIQHGYANIMFAALAGGVGIRTDAGFNGTQAYDWMLGNIKFQDTVNTNPMWTIRAEKHIINLRRIGNTVYFTAPDGGACSWANNPASSFDSNDVPIAAGGRSRSVDVTGLSGIIRITCGPARTNVGL